MDAYEFSTQVTETGYVAIPPEYVNQIPQGTAVSVVILVNQDQTKQNGQNGYGNGYRNGYNGESISLEELIAEIKSKPSKPEHIHPASGKLAEHLANPITESDPNFDPAEWDCEWAEIESEMKAASLAHEEEEQRSWMK